jgi:hypothetical protein
MLAHGRVSSCLTTTSSRLSGWRRHHRKRIFGSLLAGPFLLDFLYGLELRLPGRLRLLRTYIPPFTFDAAGMSKGTYGLESVTRVPRLVRRLRALWLATSGTAR